MLMGTKQNRHEGLDMGSHFEPFPTGDWVALCMLGVPSERKVISDLRSQG